MAEDENGLNDGPLREGCTVTIRYGNVKIDCYPVFKWQLDSLFQSGTWALLPATGFSIFLKNGMDFREKYIEFNKINDLVGEALIQNGIDKFIAHFYEFINFGGAIVCIGLLFIFRYKFQNTVKRIINLTEFQNLGTQATHNEDSETLGSG